jgi:hypothetical protein
VTSVPAGSGRGLVDAAHQGRYHAVATVFEAAGTGPQLRLGPINAPLPPCSGPPIIGWSWEETPHPEAGDIRWESYVVVGRYDGTSFTLTEPTTARGADDAQSADLPQFDTPWRQPTGGWVPPHLATATYPACESAVRLARHLRRSVERQVEPVSNI